AGSTTYADKNLPMGSTWFYRVRAYNAGGNSGYSTAAAATTANVPPVLGVIGNKTIFEGSTLLVTNTAIAPESVQLVTDFEPFMTETANGAVLFREPRNSASTSAFLDAAPNLAAITDVFSTAGNSSTRALRISCNFTNGNNPWLRLTTASAATFPNPIIDVAKQLRFSVYADKAIQVAVGCRETTTAAGTALGSDGGATGAIEWAGVTNLAGTAPMPTRTVNAGNWTTLTFNLPNEPILSCSGGNGVLATASGLAVLEHLAIVPAAGTGVYNVYLDNFAMVAPRPLTYSLGPGAPAGATLHPSTGLFAWTPTEAQGPSTNTLSILVTDDSVPPLSATNTFTVVVLPKPTLQAVSRPDGGFTLTWDALPGATYRVQYKTDLADADWMDLGTAVIASASTASLNDTPSSSQRFYRILVNQ
ncbi:MAG TPA: cadherin repeat domain-containing protein, partial [Candidatus Sulfotelmatobacter sp.]|nr:cadherin repeat domain-containing protein [Candidatus Sulfotelmatobacter sp.]